MKRQGSIKKKLFQIIMISTLACVLMSFAVSFVAVYSVEKRQIRSSMRFTLGQIKASLDQGYLSLVNVMNGLEADGSTGQAVTSFLEERDNYQRAVKKHLIEEEISNVLFLNLDVRAVAYIDSENGEILFASGTVSELQEEREEKQEIKQVGELFFYGIENGQGEQSGYLISAINRGQGFGEKQLDILVEQRVERFGERDFKLLQLDEDGRICYTETEDFPIGSLIEDEEETDKKPDQYASFNQGKYHLMTIDSEMGFRYALAVPLSVYNQESNTLRMRMIIVMAASFCLFYLIVLAIYQMIGKPIQKLKVEIEETGKGNLGAIKEETGIEEFNQVLEGIARMRTDLRLMQQREKEEEDLRKKAEVEKLMYQINPHFVLNTLYSVQWMAQRAGNTQIREFVHNFIAILTYNLGKEGAASSIRTEVEIARKYIEIQKQRYDFEIRMEVEEGRYLDTPTIRMLLQPLIENTLQHGLGASGRMEIWIFEDPKYQYAVIIVRDYGEGLSREKLEELNRPLGSTEGKRTLSGGIGLRYVRSMLEAVYQGEAILDVNSALGRGTKISILIPLSQRDRKEDEIFD